MEEIVRKIKKSERREKTQLRWDVSGEILAGEGDRGDLTVEVIAGDSIPITRG